MENNSLDFIDFKMLDFINEFSELFKSLTEEKDLQNEDIKRAKHLIHISKEIENSIESCDIFDLKNESLDQNLELQKEIKKKKLEEFNQIRQIADNAKFLTQNSLQTIIQQNYDSKNLN